MDGKHLDKLKKNFQSPLLHVLHLQITKQKNNVIKMESIITSQNLLKKTLYHKCYSITIFFDYLYKFLDLKYYYFVKLYETLLNLFHKRIIYNSL